MTTETISPSSVSDPSPSGAIPATGPSGGDRSRGEDTSSAGTAQSDALSLIDWRDTPPDGTEPGLRRLLASLAGSLHGFVSIGLDDDFSSMQVWSSDGETASAELQSAVLEASRAETCLYAAPDNQSSWVLQQLRQQSDAPLALSFAVPSGDADLRIGLIVRIEKKSKLQTPDRYARWVTAIRQELPRWMETWRLARLGRSSRRLRSRVHFYRYPKGKILLTVLAVASVCLAVPVPYWPSRQCTVEPASRQFLASPIEGRISEALVRPGDVVAAGQLLARLDDEPLRWKLASAEAELEAARKKRDSALATRSGGDLRLAQLEQERIVLEIQSLERQLQQLEVRCPAEGIVVDGEWYQSEGAPVARGDTLFEIAPLDRMQIETHLSSEDLAHIHAGQRATVRVDAAPGIRWTEDIRRIDPRGQVIDSQVVFTADMEVANRDGALRPGMKGRVRISAGTKPLGWQLLQKPYTWLVRKWLW